MAPSTLLRFIFVMEIGSLAVAYTVPITPPEIATPKVLVLEIIASGVTTPELCFDAERADMVLSAAEIFIC